MYIVGGIAAVVLIVGIVCFVCRVRDQRIISLEVKKDREEGLVKSWGVRRASFAPDMDDMDAKGGTNRLITDEKPRPNVVVKDEDDILGEDQQESS